MLHRLPHILVSLILFVFLCMLSLAQQSDKSSLVTITVTDIARAPIPHAKIELIPASGTTHKQPEAGNDGKLSIRLAPGNYDLKVSFPAFVTATRHLQVASSANQTVSFALGSRQWLLRSRRSASFKDSNLYSA
jgi:Carboxypeptidase regulatory-like domain